ncbi:MAG: CDP-alcohol phosphatidyltransferase family protein [Patescibacteria group bacterium]|jgi:CDP-diacylglycerol--glycerol-3-phosphate 3-phosphatidyltransferase
MFFLNQAYPEKWNQQIRLLPTDRLLARTVIPLIPGWVKPNHLTLLRIFLIIPVLLLLSAGNYAWGVSLFLFAAFTDALDGALARVRREITEWGIVFDPVADKLFIGSVLFVIVLRYINFYLGVSLLAVEAFVIVFGWWRMRRGVIEPANFWGKVKMAFEVAGVLLILVALWFRVDLLADLSASTLALALICALVSVYTRIK